MPVSPAESLATSSGQPSLAAVQAHAAPLPEPLIVGVLLDGAVQEGWMLHAVRQALQVAGVKLGPIAILHARQQTRAGERLHRVIDRIDGRLRCHNDPLLAPVDVPAALGARAPLEITVGNAECPWHLDLIGAATLRAVRADVWLWLCPGAPRTPLPAISALGIWGLEIGAHVPAASAWAGAAEVGFGSDVTLAQVVDYTRPDRDVLYRAHGTTLKNSARRNRLLVLRKAVSFFARLLRSIKLDPAASRLQPAELLAVADAGVRPSGRAALRVATQLASQVLRNRCRALLWRDQWRIGYFLAASEEDAAYTSPRMHHLVPPRDRDWADPFIVRHGRREFIFFEDLPYSVGRAHISAVEIHENGECGPPQLVLQRPYHLSYPFVFAWKGELYMIPETASNETVELYRCEQFPQRWSLCQVLMEGIRAFDATLLREGRRWWMFASVAEPGADPNEELCIYWSDSPLGPWQPHARNPVISDVRRARSAGPLFRRDGVLYRPSQDCAATYGSAVWINRVDVLDTTRYQETPVSRIEPDRMAGMNCLHTFGAAGRLRVLDFNVRRPRWSGS